jgi:DNA-directed RNA polymerase specialized sigma24 family protein
MYDEELRSRATTRAFQKLEAPYREALLIYAEERKRGRAIAEELGINENTAKVRVFRGKPKLLRRLREEGVTL